MAMTKVTTGLEVDLTVVIEKCHSEIVVEVDLYKISDRITDRIIKGDHKTITEMTLGEEIIGRCLYRDDYRSDNYDRGRRSRSRERQYSHNPRRDDRNSSKSASICSYY